MWDDVLGLNHETGRFVPPVLSLLVKVLFLDSYPSWKLKNSRCFVFRSVSEISLSIALIK